MQGVIVNFAPINREAPIDTFSKAECWRILKHFPPCGIHGTEFPAPCARLLPAKLLDPRTQHSVPGNSGSRCKWRAARSNVSFFWKCQWLFTLWKSHSKFKASIFFYSYTKFSSKKNNILFSLCRIFYTVGHSLITLNLYSKLCIKKKNG